MRKLMMIGPIAGALTIAASAQAQMCGSGGSAGGMCGMGQPAQSGQSMPGMSMPGMSGMMHGPQGGAQQGQSQGGMMQGGMTGCPMMKQMAALSERVRQMEDMMKPSSSGVEPPKH